jgi:hypothetical protein
MCTFHNSLQQNEDGNLVCEICNTKNRSQRSKNTSATNR